MMTCMTPGCDRPSRKKGLCQRCYTRRRRTDPGIAERERESSRRWKRENRERTLAYMREYRQHPCAKCGAVILKDATLCLRCEHERRRARYPEIQRRWLAGETLKEIAAALDTTVNSVGVTMYDMRNAGWDLPMRLKRKATR